MKDREAAGERLLKTVGEWNAEGRAFIEGLPDVSLLALRDALADAAYRAGQASMREPTEAMLRAGVVTLCNLTGFLSPPDARAVWDAMWKARDG